MQSLKQFPIILINLSSPLLLSHDSLNETALLQLVEVCNAEQRSLLLLRPVQVELLMNPLGLIVQPVRHQCILLVPVVLWWLGRWNCDLLDKEVVLRALNNLWLLGCSRSWTETSRSRQVYRYVRVSSLLEIIRHCATSLTVVLSLSCCFCPRVTTASKVLLFSGDIWSDIRFDMALGTLRRAILVSFISCCRAAHVHNLWRGLHPRRLQPISILIRLYLFLLRWRYAAKRSDILWFFLLQHFIFLVNHLSYKTMIIIRIYEK